HMDTHPSSRLEPSIQGPQDATDICGARDGTGCVLLAGDTCAVEYLA
ncbi:hypothetical protein H8E07_14670, partial [bacterium]|nr:hypothetical protein [bacterium]